MNLQPSDGISDKLSAVSLELSPRHSPALINRNVPSVQALELDLSLSTALGNLISHFVSPLTKLYPAQTISALRLHLTSVLTELYTPTWDTKRAQHGSGYRSLICNRERGLPKALAEAAREVGINASVWKSALARRSESDEEGKTRGDEWEAWCDPGTVVWRYGGWEWEDIGYDPFKGPREQYTIVWQSSSSPRPAPRSTVSSEIATSTTPARTSRAIPIRAPVALPAVYAIPPTPAMMGEMATVPEQPRASSPLLPSVSLSRSGSPSHSDISSGYESAASNNGDYHSRSSTNATSFQSKISHRGTGSTSSTSSAASEMSGAQLLTPSSRPPSVDPFCDAESSKSPTPTGPLRGRSTSPSQSTPRELSSATPNATTAPIPTVTPYDGGNVTVMGGGVKLGGGSRPASAMALGRTGLDRSRSPSISLASRALTSALGPNGQPTQRKARTRRRIMPTYLGHLNQPGVGGPIMGPFGQFPAAAPPWQGVGVGMGPPPIPGMLRPLTGNPRVSSI